MPERNNDFGKFGARGIKGHGGRGQGGCKFRGRAAGRVVTGWGA